MGEYRVTWTIDVDADDPVGAAIKARQAQTRPGTTATVFEVQESHQIRAELAPPIIEVDLAEVECRCRCREGRHCGGCGHDGCGYLPDAEQEGAPTTLTIRREGGQTYTRV